MEKGMDYGRIAQMISPNKKNRVPQCKPLPGQIPNNAGGYYYAVDDWALLDRFLILGTESGTYYVQPVQLTKESAQAVTRLLVVFGPAVVDRIVEISQSGRAAKNDPALFALALAASSSNEGARLAALAALSKVARTGTHLLMFARFVNAMRGWGRGLRRAVGRWFLDMPLERLALQAIKYSQREGWSLRDLLRLSHPKTKDEKRSALIDWIVHPDKPEAAQAAQKVSLLVEGKYVAQKTDVPFCLAAVVHKYALPREALDTQALNNKEVWGSLLINMPVMAMIRNLSKMTSLGLLSTGSPATELVVRRLKNKQLLADARIHPVQLLLALRTYAQGRGALGSLVWHPNSQILRALDDAFYGSFDRVKPTGKRLLVGLDVSGSMLYSPCVGSPILGSVEAASAMAMMFARTEPHVHTVAFDTDVRPVDIQKNYPLDQVMKLFQHGGGTDVAQPILYALRHKIVVDAFVVITDNETWAGSEHPAQALQRYRKQINPKARIVVLACAANQGSICNPNDHRALGIAGFDAAVPLLVSEFIAMDK